eukprot:1160593-Pelagomonas_calceolata.AAC.2
MGGGAAWEMGSTASSCTHAPGLPAMKGAPPGSPSPCSAPWPEPPATLPHWPTWPPRTPAAPGSSTGCMNWKSMGNRSDQYLEPPVAVGI